MGRALRLALHSGGLITKAVGPRSRKGCSQAVAVTFLVRGARSENMGTDARASVYYSRLPII
jgi:hypothetical protein